MESQTVRAPSGPWLTAACGVVVLVGAVSLVTAGDAAAVVGYGPLRALLGAAAWALFWRLAVVVDDAGVTLRNVLRTVEVPWAAIQHVDTRYALTLRTPHGRFTAWAAPAPSRSRVAHVSAADLRGLPASTYAAGRSVRPGDLPGSASGEAAAVVRLRWERLRDAGALTGDTRPRVRWHGATIALLVALVVATVLTVTWHG